MLQDEPLNHLLGTLLQACQHTEGCDSLLPPLNVLSRCTCGLSRELATVLWQLRTHSGPDAEPLHLYPKAEA